MKTWVSTQRFTVLVETDEAGVIREAAPLVRVFVGQPLDNLLRWAKRFGGLKTESWPRDQSRQRCRNSGVYSPT